MSARTMTIGQIGATDEGGGAATVARALMQAYTAHGHRVRHFVGRKSGSDARVIALLDDDRLPFRLSGYTSVQDGLGRLAGRFPGRGFGRLSRSLRLATHPAALSSWFYGDEDFDFPATARFLDQLPELPDVIHAHNLHGGFFDLRALAPISARVPTIVTLHDMWMLTGHCAHSLDCDRWQSGCGECPSLGSYPAVRRDATASNWQRKRQIYAEGRLHIATPSHWLRDKVAASMLGPAAASLRVIPNGVDTAVFRPRDRAAVRRELGLPVQAQVVLLTVGSAGSMWKDEATVRGVVMTMLEERAGDMRFVKLGGRAGMPDAALHHVPFQTDPTLMAKYYQAADVYLHCSHADSFPLAPLEAMACGTPVVATAVGGIPEQVRSTDPEAIRSGRVANATGVLLAPHNHVAAAAAVTAVLRHDRSRTALGHNAVADVHARFRLSQQVAAYLDWYDELIHDRPV